MNNKGFTLIEAIMVIALIAVIAVILVPNVINMINKNDTESCNNLKKNIISATKIYVKENKYDLGFTCSDTDRTSVKYITLKVLIDAGKISSSITNPSTKAEIPDTSKVKVTFNCDTKDFTYEIDSIC